MRSTESALKKLALDCCQSGPPADDFLDRRPVLGDQAWLLNHQFQRRHRIRHAEEDLCRRQWHENEVIVVLEHADIEDCGDGVGPHPRNGPEGAGIALWTDQRQLVADAQSEPLRHPDADRDVFVMEIVQGAPDDMVRHGRPDLEVLGRDAAHDGARRYAPHGHKRLRFHRGRDRIHAGDTAQPVGQRAVVGQRSLKRVDVHMPVEPEHPSQQLGPEAVHDGHHDDQRRHAKADAQEREAGDHRNEAFLPPRAKIAHRDHAFESAEDHACKAFMNLEWVAANR